MGYIFSCNYCIHTEMGIDEKIVSVKIEEVVENIIHDILKERDGIYRIECGNRIMSFLNNSKLENRTIIYGLILLDRLCEKGEEIKIMNNHMDLMFMFICCVIIGYKMENIDHFRNSGWCSEKIGYLDLKTVNECESFVIGHLNFNLLISKKEYDEKETEIKNRMNLIK